MAISDEMRKTEGGAPLLRLEQRFWERAVEGAQNLAYRLAYSTLIKSAQAMGQMAEEWTARELRANDYRAAIAKAIAEGDAARAEVATRDAMRKAVDVLASRVPRSADVVPEPIAPSSTRASTRARRTRKTK